MGSDGKPPGLAIHASAVAIAGRAILLLGPSKSGKSSLAAALIARSSALMPIGLIGDDRILLQRIGDRMVARVHPRIVGFIERRGLGIVASAFIESAVVDAIVCLGATTMPHPSLANVVVLRPPSDGPGDALADRVFSWVCGRFDAAAETHVVGKDDSGATSAPKD